MADNYSMFSALSDITEDLSELTLKMESQEFKEKKHKAHSVHNLSSHDNSSIHNKHRKNSSNASNLLSPPWEKKHSRRTLSDGNWNMKKENPSKNDKTSNNSSTNTLKAESKEDLSRTPSLPSKWSIKRATLYKTELCRAFEETGKCKFGDECIFAHSEEELRPRVDRHPKYKTRICRTFWEQGECPYGKRCCFIHTERDITHPDDFSVFEAQMQQQINNNLSTSSLLNGSHRRMQSAPEIVHKHRPSNSSDTFMGGIYSMTPLDRRSIHSEKSSIRSFDTTKESSKLKEEIKMTSSDDEDLSDIDNTPSVVLMDETGSITEIIKKPKKTQRITKFLKVGGHKNNNNNSNNILDVNLIKNDSIEGKNKSKWFSRNKNNQNKEQKEKKNKEESTSTGRKILSFGRKDKDKEKEKEKDQVEKPEKEKHSKFFPFVRSHSNNETNETVEAFPNLTVPPPIPTEDFIINNNSLSIPPPIPSPPLEKMTTTNNNNNVLAADALFGNTEPVAPVDDKPKTEESVATETKDKKKIKNLSIDASSQPVKVEEISSPRRFIPNFLLSAISKTTTQKEKEEK